MDRKDRLKMAFEYARSKGFVHTQKDLASLINASEGNISKALKGDPKVLTDRFLRRFNEAFSNIFSLDWLCLGEGEMIVGDEEAIIKERNKMLADNVEFAIATRNDSEVGEKLRLYFNRQGISQVDIAEKLGVSKAYVNALFNGNSTFGKKTAEKWEAEFGISKSFLLTGNGQMLVGDQNPIGDKRNERFEKAINYLRMQGVINKNEEVATKMGADASNVSRAIKGAGNNPTDRFLRRFNEAFSNIFSLDWLLTGEGDMLLGEPKTSAPAVPTVSYTTGRPYYNVDFLAGFDLVFNDQTINPEYYIDFAPYNRQGAIWCNITGDSMTPKISSGDIIALLEIEGWREFLSFGEIYAIVTTNGLRTVKIIRKGSADDRVRLVPLNTKEYDEQEIPLSVISKVFQVIGCMKKL